MCVQPITLNRPRNWDSPVMRVDRLYHPSLYRKLYPDTIQVPCGKCVECVKAKQNDYMQVFLAAARKYMTMHFVTLTYRNLTLPLAIKEYSQVQFNAVTGEPALLPFNDDSWIALQLKALYWKDYHKGDIVKDKCITLDGVDYLVCPEVRRRHVALWHKKMRQRWFDQKGEKFPDFKVSYVTEYGSKTYRPHVHALYFGLSRYHLDWMLEEWKKEYGFVCVDTIPIMSKNDDAKKVANYVSKYVNKGCFECDLLKKVDYIERPRICTSVGLCSLTPEQVAYYNGLDIHNVSLEDFIKRVLERRKVQIGAFRYNLGKHFVDKLTKIIDYEFIVSDVYRAEKSRPIYDESGNILGFEKRNGVTKRPPRCCQVPKDVLVYETKTKTTRTQLQELCKNFLFRLHDVRLHHELETIQKEFPSASYTQVAELYYSSQKDSLETRKKVQLESMKKIYQRSVF